MDTQASPQPLEDFAKQLLQEANYTLADTELESEILKDITTRVNDTITARVIASLSDADVDGFNLLLEKNPSEEEIQVYIKSKIPDSTHFLIQVLGDFRKTYLGLP